MVEDVDDEVVRGVVYDAFGDRESDLAGSGGRMLGCLVPRDNDVDAWEEGEQGSV
jgi:hypothetical protein